VRAFVDRIERSVFFVIVTVFGFSVVSIIHEAGHLAAAKACNLAVVRYQIFGGQPWAKVQWGETVYAIGSIPLFSFVWLSGEETVNLKEFAEMESADPQRAALLKDEDRWIENKGFLIKLAVLLGGSFFNLAFAFLSFMVILKYLQISGFRTGCVCVTRYEQFKGSWRGSPYEWLGELQSINGKAVHTIADAERLLRSTGQLVLKVSNKRHSETLQVGADKVEMNAPDPTRPRDSAAGKLWVHETTTFSYSSQGWLVTAAAAVQVSWEYLRRGLRRIFFLLLPIGERKIYPLSNIFHTAVDMHNRVIIDNLSYLAILNLIIGAANLVIPIPPMDGAQTLILCAETFFRPMSEVARFWTYFIGMKLLIAFMIVGGLAAIVQHWKYDSERTLI
jgi:membrane-associated protease RseP (regulator of RpoE activity)